MKQYPQSPNTDPEELEEEGTHWALKVLYALLIILGLLFLAFVVYHSADINGA
jgi:hypothetical protein